MLDNAIERILRETNDLEGAEHLVDVEGLSSARVCNLLNRLVASMEPGEHYLEIGTWKGRTLLSAAWQNRGKLVVGCDKFRFWGRHTGWGSRARSALLANLAQLRDRADVRFFDMTSHRLFEERRVPGPVGVYFYDGGHGYGETRHGIEAGAPLLSARAAVLVDDWNDPVIRRATFDGLSASRLDVLWHRHLEGRHGEDGFWNGVGAFYVRRQGWM